MSARKNRESQSVHPVNAESPKPQGQASSPSGPGKSPGRMVFFLWGIPLILFIVVAVVKQCGG